MVFPLLNMTIKGAIWYQGEANAGKNPSPSLLSLPLSPSLSPPLPLSPSPPLSLPHLSPSLPSPSLSPSPLLSLSPSLSSSLRLPLSYYMNTDIAVEVVSCVHKLCEFFSLTP